VAGGNDGTLTRIDPRRNAVEATLKLGGSDPLAPRPVFLVTTGEGAVWVARLRDVLRIDPETNEVTARVAVNGPLGIAAGAESVWVTTIDERILRIDARTAVVSASAQLPDQGYFPVVAGVSVWLLTLNQNGQVERFDPDTLSSTATVPILLAIGLAAGEGALWTAGHGDGKVWRIDPASARAVSIARVSHHPLRVAVGAGAAWIGVQRELLR
jgi:DNA-binding beta-propeller fold protein YncE